MLHTDKIPADCLITCNRKMGSAPKSTLNNAILAGSGTSCRVRQSIDFPASLTARRSA